MRSALSEMFRSGAVVRASDAARSQWPLWAFVIVASLALRLWVVQLVGTSEFGGDTLHYLRMAGNLLSGRGLVIDDPFNVPNMRATYPPLYPILLAGVGAIVPLSTLVIALLNTAFDFACAGLLVLLGRQLGLANAGRLAAMLYILWPTHIGLVPMARKEALVALFVVALLCVLVALARRPNIRLAAGYGVIAGLLALTQPGLIVLPALLALSMLPWFEDKMAWLKAMSFAGGCTLLVLAPWWIRNWLLFQRFVPLTVAGEYSLWVGATPTGDGTWIQPPRRFRQGDEFALSAALGAEARAIIAADPVRYFVHCMVKFGKAMVSDVHGAAVLKWVDPRTNATLAWSWAIVAALAHLAALWLAMLFVAIRRRDPLTSMLLAGIAHMLLFGIWFEFDERHRYFLTPILLLCAAAGLLDLLTRMRTAKARTANLRKNGSGGGT